MPTLLGAIDTNTSWYLALAALLTALLIGIPMALRVLREIKGEGEPETVDERDLFKAITQAFASGQMSKEEYLKAKASLMGGGHDAPAVSKPTPEKPELVLERSEPEPEAPGTASE